MPSRLRARVARTTHTHHPYNDKCLAFHGTSACVSMDTPLRVLGWNICVCLDGYKSACVSISWNICTCSRMEHLCVSRWNICVCSMCSTRMLGVAKLHLATSWTLIAGTLCSTGGNTGPYARSSSWRAGAPMCLWRHHAVVGNVKTTWVRHYRHCNIGTKARAMKQQMCGTSATLKSLEAAAGKLGQRERRCRSRCCSQKQTREADTPRHCMG